MSKRVFKKLGLLLTAVLVFSLLVPAFPAAAATAKTYIIGVEFVEDELGKVIIETNKAANTADLTKYVKLSGRKGSWEDLGDNCYEGTFSGLRYKYRYTLTATGKFAFKGVSLRDRQYRWTEPTTPPPQQEVQLTLDQTSVSVEQGQSVDVSFTVSPADASVTAASSNTAVATVAVGSGRVTIEGVAPGSATVTLTATKSGYQSATATISVTVAAAELRVVSASAANATTVEVAFNRAPTASEQAELTYTFAGSPVAASNIAYSGARATLTVPAMVDNASYAVVVAKGATVLYSQSVTYDMNLITAIRVLTTHLNQTIGENFTLTVRLEDEDGDGIPNKELRLESPDYTWQGLEPLIVLSATTGPDGVATFTWTRMHDSDTFGPEMVTVYSVDRPVVRQAVNVTWTLAARLVTLDAAGLASETLSDESAFEFTVTARNADGSNYVGNLVLDFNVTHPAGSVVSLRDDGDDANIKIQCWNAAAGRWDDGVAAPGTAATGELIETGNTTATYEMTAADNGTKRFRVFTKDEGGLLASDVDRIVVTVWYDADSSGGLSARDPRATTGAKSYVQGIPTISFAPLDQRNVIATDPVNDDGMERKLYSLSVRDQFGKPYRGTVRIREHAEADGLATTLPDADNSWLFAADTDGDGTFDVADSNTLDIDTRIRLEVGGVPVQGDDLNDDSAMVIRVMNADANETTTPVAFVDIPNPTGAPDVAGVIDANDVYALAPAAISTQARRIATITVTPQFTANPAAGATAQWSVRLTDQFGTDIPDADLAPPNADDIEIELFNNATGAQVVAATGEDLFIDRDGGTPFTPHADTTGLGGNAPIVLRDQDVAANNFTFQLRGGQAGTTYRVRVYSDVDDSDSFQVDEPSAEVTVTFAQPVLAGGAITGGIANARVYDGAGDGNAATASQAIGAQYVAEFDAANVATIRYNLLDQSGQAYATGANETVTVVWTVTNNTPQAATIGTGAPTPVTLAAGATATFTTTVAAGGNSWTQITITPAAAGAFDVRARIQGNNASERATQVVYLDEALITQDSATPRMITGTIVGVQRDGDDDGTVATNEGTILVIRTSIGQYVAVQIPNADGDANYDGGTLRISGNTVTSEAVAEGTGANVAVGDSIRVTLDASGGPYDANDVIEIRY